MTSLLCPYLGSFAAVEILQVIAAVAGYGGPPSGGAASLQRLDDRPAVDQQ
jgi:hypothetical protein